MEKIKLGNICDLYNGFAFKSDDYVDQSGTLNCRMSNIRPDGSFDILYNAKYLPDEYADKYKDYLLEDGDLIIAMTDMAGDPKILGVPTVVETKGYKLLLNQRVGKLKLLRKNIDVRYLKLALLNHNVRRYLKRFAGGGVQLNVSKKDILNTPIILRDFSEQKVIANKFDKIIRIKKMREEQLYELNNLIKSRFVEMFGKEIDDTAEELRNLCAKITDGTHQSPQFVKEGIPFIFISNIQDYKINYDTEKYISQETYDELTKNTAIELGDVLLTIVGSYGNPAVVDDDKKFCFQRHIAQLKPKHDLVNSYYLHTALRVPYVREQIDYRVKGIAQKTLNLSELSKVKINVPELSRQNEFVSFVQHTDKLKSEVQKFLDEMQVLFDSLMQEYFE